MTVDARRQAETVDVLLEDGGHVVVSFADPEAGHGETSVDLVTTLVRAGPSEADLARAIVDEATRSGLDCRVTSTGDATVVEVRTAEVRTGE